VVEALLAAGADKGLAMQNGCTALYAASQEGQGAVVKALLAAGANTDTKTEDGWTALCAASERGHLAVVEALLAAGADKHAKTDDGHTAHDAATAQGHPAVAQALVRGPSVDYSPHSLEQLKGACRAKGLPVGGTKDQGGAAGAAGGRVSVVNFEYRITGVP
jgi:ankyrin repeat protein